MATKLSRRQIARNHIEAMQHELRREIWKILTERTASPKEMAEELNEDTPQVSHHTKRLVELGFAELVSEKKVRGTIAHYYRAIERILIENEDWNQLLDENPMLANHLLGQVIQVQLSDYEAAIKAGTLGSDDQWHIGRTPGLVDSEGLAEALELADEVDQRFAEIVRRSAERRGESGEDAIRMSACVSFFKTP